MGDIVATYSEPLRAWTAAQITGLGATWGINGQAGVLELDWSGPEPDSLGDLGDLRPLRLTHHAHRNRLSHCNFEWLLPRGYKVIGNAPLLRDGLADGFSSGWRVGEQLASQRRWDSGEGNSDPGDLSLDATQLASLLSRYVPMAEVWRLKVGEIESLNCADLVTRFPNLTRLSLSGNLGTLEDAAALQQMSGLRTLFVQDLFGMSAADRVTIDHLPRLEMLGLYSVPADYAAAMRKAWKPEVANGTCMEIRSPRRPEWVDENRDNPLRDWDGRDHISPVRYRKAVAKYRATRRAVIAALAPDGVASVTETLTKLGREFADAFNRLDGSRNPFIETEEREELFASLVAAVAAAEAHHGQQFSQAAAALAEGAEEVRTW